MRATPLGEIHRRVLGRWVATTPKLSVLVARVTIDSRKATPGDLFVAIHGAQFDGHHFLGQAAAAGCTAAIVEAGREIDPAVAGQFAAVISVPSTLEALARLAEHERDGFGGKVIGVTGSVGKTTVKGMVHHILSAHKKGSAAPKSFNNNIGVPLTLLAASESDDYVVCELGSNAPGEIPALTRIAQPDIAVITAVGESHLERLGSIEGVAAEKAAILALLEKRGGTGIIWADSDVLAGNPGLPGAADPLRRRRGRRPAADRLGRRRPVAAIPGERWPMVHAAAGRPAQCQ
jgi:UDP-N-acetylmuramoyl-tripeptide--D-alanyl-D-alanine ligase